MFNSLHVHEQGNSSNTTTVHEHRAPTDESVRILKQLEDEARAKVQASVRTESCAVDCVVHYHYDEMNCQKKFTIFANIGGKAVIARTETQALSVTAITVEELHAKLVDALAERIAVEILAEPFARLAKQLRGKL